MKYSPDCNDEPHFRYSQMIGRGLRSRFGCTERCVIVNLEDKDRSARPELDYQRFRDQSVDFLCLIE